MEFTDEYLNTVKKEFISVLTELDRDKHVTERIGVFGYPKSMSGLIEYLGKDTDFFTAPASSQYHLSCKGGLLVHSLNVMKRLRGMVVHEIAVAEEEGKETLVKYFRECLKHGSVEVVALLHDLCKANFYTTEPKNQKTYDAEKIAAAPKWQVKNDSNGPFIWETVMRYTIDEKLPLGHGEKSLYIANSFLELSHDEALCIRWHMGFSGSEFKGGDQSVGKAFEKSPLAMLLHIADLQATYFDESEA